MPGKRLQVIQRVLYAKGGRAIAEAQKLFPLAGMDPPPGPDQFLLSAMRVYQGSEFRLVSVGPENKLQSFEKGSAAEYALRPTNTSTLHTSIVQIGALIRFCAATLRWRPTVILGGIEGPMGIAGLCMSKILRAQFIYLVHTDIAAPSLSNYKRILNRIVAQYADAVIVHGPFLRDRLSMLGCPAERLWEFDTGFVSEATVRDLQQEKGEKSAPPTLVYAGRIERDKGVFDLLRAFETVAHETSVRLIFAGDGGALQRLSEQSMVSRHASNISVLGSLPHSEVMGWLTKAVATVTPTQSCFPEGRCMSAMESLLMGVPVIAPDFGAFPYLVKHEDNGLLFKPDSVPSLAATLRSMLNNPGLLSRLQQGAQRSAAELMHPRHTFLSCLQEIKQRLQTDSNV